MKDIVKLALIILILIVERITGHRFSFWRDGTERPKKNEQTTTPRTEA